MVRRNAFDAPDTHGVGSFLRRAFAKVLNRSAGACVALVLATVTAQAQWRPTTAPATLGVSNTSTATPATFPQGPATTICNVGSNNAYVAFGGSTVAATTANDLVATGSCRPFQVVAGSYLAAITASSTTTLNISGGSCGSNDCGAGGGGGSTGGGATNATIVAPLGPSTANTAAVASTDTGTAGSGITICAGAEGIKGWLSCIENLMSSGVYSQNGTFSQFLAGGAQVTTSTWPSPATNTNATANMDDKYGRRIVQASAPVDNWQFPSTAGQTGNATVTILNASGSGSLREWLTWLSISRTDTGTAPIDALITDGTITYHFDIPANGAGGGREVPLPAIGLPFAANTAVTCKNNSTGVTTFYCHGAGYNAP